MNDYKNKEETITAIPDKTDLEKLHAEKYVVLKNTVSPDILALVGNYCDFRIKMKYFDNDGISKNVKYGDLVTESLLLTLQPLVERLVNKKLSPTYSYLRVYKKNDSLKCHTDRDACEYSLTLPITFQSDYLWPIFIKDKNDVKIDVELDKGDILLYKGCEVPHGRDPFTGELWIQVFLHYVDPLGEKAGYIFDKRRNLGIDPPKASFFQIAKKIISRKLKR